MDWEKACLGGYNDTSRRLDQLLEPLPFTYVLVLDLVIVHVLGAGGVLSNVL